MYIYTRKGIKIRIDREDFQLANSHTWCLDGRGYPSTMFRINGKQKSVKLHRLIMNAPVGKNIDHINGDPLDNRRKNLRFASFAQNCANRRKSSKNTSGYKGVYFRISPGTQKSWIARVGTRGKIHNCGSYKDPQEAAHAYNKKAVELFGEFARLNVLPKSHHRSCSLITAV